MAIGRRDAGEKVPDRLPGTDDKVPGTDDKVPGTNGRVLGTDELVGVHRFHL